MAIRKQTELVVERRFEPRRGRHVINGAVHVLHCHHYLTLYTQLAEDCGMLDGRKLLVEAAEDSFRPVLEANWKAQQATSVEDRIALAEQYYAFTGLGKMRVAAVGPDTARVELEHSHVDEGWRKKWGGRAKPVNYITAGFVAALLAGLFGAAPRAWRVREEKSIVAGADRSVFRAVRA